MIVEHRQRPDRCVAVLLSLEVHLPQLVGPLSCEALRRLLAPLLVQHQTMAHQHTMHRDHRQPDAVTLQQNRQLARAPVRPLPTQRHDPLFDRGLSLTRAHMRSAAALLHPGHTLFSKPPQPQIPGRSRNRVLPTQCAQRLAAARSHNKLHPLIPHPCLPPRHPHLDQPKSRPEVKNVLITTCKECHETEHKSAHGWGTRFVAARYCCGV